MPETGDPRTTEIHCPQLQGLRSSTCRAQQTWDSARTPFLVHRLCLPILMGRRGQQDQGIHLGSPSTQSLPLTCPLSKTLPLRTAQFPEGQSFNTGREKCQMLAAHAAELHSPVCWGGAWSNHTTGLSPSKTPGLSSCHQPAFGPAPTCLELVPRVN